MARWVKVPGTVLVKGQPEANVEIFVYQPGSTVQIPVYADEGYTPLEQPILSGSAGTFQFYVNQESYPKIRLFFRKVGVDFTETNLIYDGITLP